MRKLYVQLKPSANFCTLYILPYSSLIYIDTEHSKTTIT